MTDIIRVPIKIRKAIQKDYCSCWGTKVFSVDDVPFLTIVDDVPIETLAEMLNTLDSSTGFYIQKPLNKETEQKVLMILSHKLPVTINTSKVLPDHIIEAMTTVPHSSIHASINFLDYSTGNKIEPADTIDDIRDMLYYAKNHKVFTVLSIKYYPHLVPKLDLFEVVDRVKNQVSHIVMEFPEITDEIYYTHYKTLWEALVPNSLELFRKYYQANVLKRSWEIKPKYIKEFMKDMQLFIKPKKLGMEVMENFESDNRIRHKLSGMVELPLGMRPFWYKKVDDVFEKVEDVPSQDCPKCLKPIFQ